MLLAAPFVYCVGFISTRIKKFRNCPITQLTYILTLTTHAKFRPFTLLTVEMASAFVILYSKVCKETDEGNKPNLNMQHIIDTLWIGIEPVRNRFWNFQIPLGGSEWIAVERNIYYGFSEVNQFRSKLNELQVVFTSVKPNNQVVLPKHYRAGET